MAKDGFDFDKASKLLGIAKACADTGGVEYIAAEATAELDLMNHNLRNAHLRKQGLPEVPHPTEEKAKSDAPAADDTQIDHDPKVPLPIAEDKPLSQRRT